MPEDDYDDVDPIVGGVRWRPMGRSEYHVDPTFAVRPVKRDRDGEPERATTRRTRAAPKVKSPEDLTELHGIPEDAMSDPLRAIVMEMIDEAGDLHEQLLAAEDRIDFLEEHSRYDRLGEWLSTTAMLGQIRHLADLDQREGLASSLAGIALTDYGNLAKTGSWSDAERAMAQIGEVLSVAAPSGDVVGRLWDGAFGILLPGLEIENARSLIDDLAKRCTESTIGVTVQTAIVPIRSDEEPEQAVDRLYTAITGAVKP